MSLSFDKNCRTVVGFLDDLVYPPPAILRQLPLLSTVICAIAAKAIKPDRFQTYVAEADHMIKNTFQGPTPDLLDLIAMMLLTAWTRRYRLWGYVASIAAELKLNECALQLEDDAFEQTEELVQRARTWLTLCCFDLLYVHLLRFNRNSLMNRQDKYQSAIRHQQHESLPPILEKSLGLSVLPTGGSSNLCLHRRILYSRYLFLIPNPTLPNRANKSQATQNPS